MNEYRKLMESLDAIAEAEVAPNANYGEVEVSIAGHRATQDPKGSHQLKVWMNQNDTKQITRNVGDAYVWQVNGVSEQEMSALVQQWYRGNMQDITVRSTPPPRPMHKVGMNWSYS